MRVEAEVKWRSGRSRRAMARLASRLEGSDILRNAPEGPPGRSGQRFGPMIQAAERA